MKKSIGSSTYIFPTPVLVVCTYDNQGKANAMTAAWGGVCCSRPPCVYVSLRKATYSYGNIVEREAFTVNIPSIHHMKEADYFGVASGRDRDKFADTGLNPIKSKLVDAPYVQEFPLSLECKLVHTFELGLHTQFVGQVLDVKVDEVVLGENGRPDIEKVQPFSFAPGMNRYYQVGSYIGDSHRIKKWE
ncbi:flavin reductase family protein [Thermodesulfobacteriota bacterium]